MKLKTLLAFLVLAPISQSVLATDSTDAVSALPCASRSWQFCRLPNVGENCNVGTCDSSLSSSGNCTIEANYNDDRSLVVSCNVCATEPLDSAACRALGGTMTSS